MVCLILMKALMLLLAMRCKTILNFKIISLVCILFAFETHDLENF